MIDVSAMPNLAEIVRHQAKIRPDDVALWFEGNETSYAQLNNRSNAVANGLIAAGVGPNDRVAYLGKNLDVYYEMLFGTVKARAVFAAMNYRLAGPEMQFVLDDSDSVVLFVSEDYYDMIDQIKADCPKLKTIIAIEGGRQDWTDYQTWRDAQDNTDPALTPVSYTHLTLPTNREV